MSQPSTEFWQEFFQYAAKCDVEAAMDGMVGQAPPNSKPSLAYCVSGAMIGGAVATGILAYTRSKRARCGRNDELDYDADNAEANLLHAPPEKDPSNESTKDDAAVQKNPELATVPESAPAEDPSPPIAGVLALQTEDELNAAAGPGGPTVIQRAKDMLKNFVGLTPTPESDTPPAEPEDLAPLTTEPHPEMESVNEEEEPVKISTTRWFF